MKRIISMLLAIIMAVMILPADLFVARAESGQSEFILPSSLTEVEEQAFAGNTSITSLVIPEQVSSIGSEAFEGCLGLKSVRVEGRTITIASDAFKNCSPNMVFYAHNDSDVMLWASEHGFICVSLDTESNYLTEFSELLAYSGFDPSLLMSNTYASRCLIVRTKNGVEALPDISAFNPVAVFKSDSNLYYIQFNTEQDTEDCFNMLYGSSLIANVEPDRIAANDDVSAQGVTISENWGTSDTMGFDVYAPFVAQHCSGSVTIAVIDSGVNQNVWNGSFSDAAISFVGGSAYVDTARHGSKVASIINDCLGANKGHVTLMPIKVVNSSSMYRTSVIIEAIKHATNNGANIINLSLGWDISEGTSPEIEHQIQVANEKGILIVAAAGNGSGNVMYPASCNGVIAVSALAYSNATGYSVRSRTGAAIDYTAPGMYLSTSAYSNIDTAGDVMGTASTSFAAPQITAALALIKLDSTRVGSVLSVLNSCCRNFGAEGLPSSAFGHGMPQLNGLGEIKTREIVVKNMDGGSIPSRLWLAENGSDFLLGWDVLPENASNKTVTIETSDSSVVSVRRFTNGTALVSAKGVGTATVTVSCGDAEPKEINLVVSKPVTEILITGSNGHMIAGKELDLAIAVLPEDAYNTDVTWQSSNENVLEISQTGHVKAKKAGKAWITCRAADGYGTSSTLEIIVIDVPDAEEIIVSAQGKEIVDNSMVLEVGETVTLEPSILPEEALQEWRYSVHPSGIVAVSEDGIVTALKASSTPATIMITATTGNNVYVGLSASVVIYPTSIGITAEKTTLDINETTILSADVLPEEATQKYKQVIWISRSPSVATVNSKTGLVRAIAPGSAEIVCSTPNGTQESITITVRRPITITLDTNNGICSEDTHTAYSGYQIGALPSATRQYWDFSGWYTEENGGTKVTSTSVFEEDTTIYAHWTGKTYTINFSADDGVCETEAMTARVGTKIGTLPVATKESHTFKGWFTLGGIEITPDYIQDNNFNMTVYAHWVSNPYTVRFNANGGTCVTESKTAGVNSAIGVLPEPERAYYVFKGWFTGKNDGLQITEEYTQSTTADVTAYAHWEPKPYLMGFNANGGICTVEQNTYYVDTDVGELPIPVREYYSFGGWYVEGEDNVYVTSTYQQHNTDDVTVFAYWTPDPYTMRFEPNGGSCIISSKQGTVDAEIGTLPDPTRNYYDFDGWYTASSGGSKIEDNYIHSTNEEITVYAHWIPHPYVMSFDANTGTNDVTEKEGLVDVAIGSLPVPTKTYYIFGGWFTAKSGGTEITASYIQKMDSAITVYAHWTPQPYIVTLDANGGNCSTTNITGMVDTEIGTLPDPTRSYYTFEGWYTAKTGGTAVTSSYSQNTTANITVYAHWSPMPYTMIFNANGNGASVPSPSTRTYYANTAVGSLPIPTRQYYDFDGWYTAATGGTKITTTYEHPNVSSITVYAHWIPNTFKVSLNPNGGTCSSTTTTGYVDTAIGSLPTPTRSGCTFKGWYTAVNGGTQITNATYWTVPNAVTIYAHWESGWVLESEVPSGAKVIATSWSYRKSTESKESSMSGWTANGSYWKQTATGSAEYATFPSGEYNTSGYSSYAKTDKYYSAMMHAPYTAYNNGTAKREVTNAHAGWIYWHWAYNAAYSASANRIIAYKPGKYGSDGWIWGYWYSIKSTVECPKAKSSYNTIGQYPKNGRTTYDCTSLINNTSYVPASDKTNGKSGLCTWRFYRLEYFTSTYKDSELWYKYYQDLTYQTTDPGNGSNISNKVKYVKWSNNQ